MRPTKDKPRTQRWENLTGQQQEHIRQGQERDALAQHALVRCGAWWGCACGCMYPSTTGQSQRMAERAHGVHMASIKYRREQLSYGNEIDYA